MKKTSCTLVLLISIIIISIAGCSNNAGSSSEGTANVFFSVARTDTFIELLVSAAEKAAGEQGVKIEIANAENNIENQVSQLKEATKSGKYDAIICILVDADTTVEIKAVTEGIPIVFLNSCPEEDLLEQGQYVYVGSDEKVAGQYQVEYVLEKLASKNELNVVLLKGPPIHPSAIERTTAVKNTFIDSGKKVNYVFLDAADWEVEKAKNMFLTFLKTKQPYDCVICNNDDMAIGVIEACKEENIDLSNIPILGVDATQRGCEAIQAGDMAFTVYQLASGQGEMAVKVAAALGNGKDTKGIEGATENGKYVWVPFEKVDKSNVSKYMK
ncbi:MAG: substrate-binding domain-containing protein [Mobilitalea sp.]